MFEKVPHSYDTAPSKKRLIRLFLWHLLSWSITIVITDVLLLEKEFSIVRLTVAAFIMAIIYTMLTGWNDFKTFFRKSHSSI